MNSALSAQSGQTDFRSVFLTAAVRQLSAPQLVERAYDGFGDRLVMSTSFGIHSAVMLHLVTRVIPHIPVIWIDTGYLFPETYQFAEELTEGLGLNLKVFQSPISPARMEALEGKLWAEDSREVLDRYDMIRKVEPMQRALKSLDAQAWLTGLRSGQTAHRSRLERVYISGDYWKILPILHWSSKEVHDYLTQHSLPIHPLFEKGYVSVGDWHSSRPLQPGDTHDRDTRFRGVKQECGLHLDIAEDASQSLDSSGL